MADEISEIRTRINIVDLVGQAVALKRSGNRYQGLCPFHDDRNPSFSVTPETGRYRCWSCGESGDIFNWVMKTRNVEFVDALQLLAEQAGVTLRSQKPEDRTLRMTQRSAMDAAHKYFQDLLPKSSTAVAYCKARDLGEEVLSKWEIGYSPEDGEALALHLKKQGFRLAECKPLFLVDGDESLGYRDKFRGRLMFPIRDERGDLVAFGGRAMGDATPKYINSSDTPLYKKGKVLYAMNIAKEAMRDGRNAVLTEGYLDAIACHSAGVKCAIASLGTALSQDHAKLLRRWCDSVTIFYDSDAAGQKAAGRATEILAAEGLRVRIAAVPEGKDPDTLLKSAGPKAVQAAAESGLSPLEFQIRSLEKAHAPDEEEFWKQAVEAIAAEPSEMERLRFIEDLAPRYPKIRDARAARSALERQVQKLKSTQARGESSENVAVPRRALIERSMLSSEITFFRALMEEQFRGELWPFLGMDDLFVTKTAHRLGGEIVRSFTNGAPEGPAKQWIESIESSVAKDLLVSVEQDWRAAGPLSEEYVADAIQVLQQKRQDRRLEELKKSEVGDPNERLREIMDHLKSKSAD